VIRLRCCPPGIKESFSTKCVMSMMEWRAGHGVTVFRRERSAFSRTKILDLERSGANDSRAIGENGSSLPIPEKCFERVKRMGLMMILLRYFLVAFQILRCESRSSREGSIDDPGAPRAIEELTPFCAKR
jgi:hypothetical protein